MTRQYELARNILVDDDAALRRLAEALFEREVLSAVEVTSLIEGRTLAPMRAKPRYASSQPRPGHGQQSPGRGHGRGHGQAGRRAVDLSRLAGRGLLRRAEARRCRLLTVTP